MADPDRNDPELKYLSVERSNFNDPATQAEWTQKRLVWVPHESQVCILIPYFPSRLTSLRREWTGEGGVHIFLYFENKETRRNENVSSSYLQILHLAQIQYQFQSLNLKQRNIKYGKTLYTT